MIAKIAVEKTAYHFDRLFDYAVPQKLESKVVPGVRVMVPFGAGSRRRQGMVYETAESGEVSGAALKSIISVLDDGPILGDELLALSRSIAERTFCPLFEAVRAMLPPGINYRPVCVYRENPDFDGREALSDEDKRIVDLLHKKKSGMSGEALKRAFGLDSEDSFSVLVSCGALACEDGALRKVGDESAKMARLSDEEAEKRADGESLLKKPTAKQREVLSFLEESGSASVREIAYFTAASAAVVDNLEKKGAVEYYEQPVYRRPYDAVFASEDPDGIVLSDEQRDAYEGLQKLCDRGEESTSLLFGVTGSGKTQVFIKLIDSVVKSGRQVIMMVPEISLTPQMINKFLAYFGSRVAVMHSALSVGERLDEWKRVRDGKADIVIGTRSAVFVPAERLGLIIMDEEQEQSYKSDRSPRFHARDVAHFRCAYNKVPLVLASATPSIETYSRALAGKYNMFVMEKRYGGAKLPKTVIVDMKQEVLEGNTGVLSRSLRSELQVNLDRGEQSILLLNRRGHSTIARCAECGEVAKCPHCSIALVYHRANGRLMCHYCGYSEPALTSCKKCGSKYMMYSGVGTQKVEDELKESFPSARVLRMDLDTTMAKFSHDRCFAEFSEGKYDIMVGTQMVAKGLDFPRVSLVGVLAADMELYTGDYRSYERTFALLTQVVGRCGRADIPGRAYIQTYSPEHSVIERAAAQDYREFYDDEIINRRVMLYPPYCGMGAVGFTGTDERLTAAAAQAFSELLERLVTERAPEMPIRLLGPTPSHIARIAGRWRYKLLVKYRPGAEFFSVMGGALREFAADKRFVKTEVTADPYFDGIV